MLGPKELANRERPVQVAEKAVAKDPKNTAYRTALGAALFRPAGLPRQPGNWPRLASSNRTRGLPRAMPGSSWPWPNSGKGNADEARASLAKAVQGLDSELATAPLNRVTAIR